MLTKKEFEKFVTSFGKKPGEYTDEEVYAIGVAHKQLALNQRNWLELANTLGIDKTGDTFRCWIKAKQKEDGTLPKDKTKLSNRTVDDLSFGEADNKLAELKRELYIQQTKTRDERQAYNRTLRDEARIESLKDCLKTSAIKLQNYKPLKYESKKVDKKVEAILMLSDLHIGAYCDNFYNKYDLDIANKRVAKVVDSTIKYCKNHNVSRLNILNLGDLIQGHIHVNARINQNENVADQVMIAAEMVANALSDLQKAAPEIIYRSVVDNHSRFTANKDEHIEKENFNRIIDWWLEQRLANTNIQFAHDNLDVGLGKFRLLNGKNVVFSHGHEDKINTAFQNMVGATREFIDYILMGHLHNTKLKSFNGSKVFVNGSLVGTEDYALSNRLFGLPEQTLLIFDGDDLLDITISLSGE